MIPALFLAHGSPMIALEDTPYTQFLGTLSSEFSPKAIVIFTAHWESDLIHISSREDQYDTIYDFGGFADELYAIQYPARGSTKIALKLKERFEQQGLPVQLDTTRGLDHGVWTLLHRVYPEANIPVIQLSVNPALPVKEQFRIGEALRGLGKEDILVVGSGGTVHNLRKIKWGQQTPEDWAVEFDTWLIDKIQRRDLDSLFKYDELAPHAQLAVPRAEHFVPLFLAFGSGDPASSPKVLHRSYDLGTLSYLGIQF